VSGRELFRAQALEEHARAYEQEGAPLRLRPRWTDAAYWLVLAAAVTSLLFVALARLPRYAEGPAMVRVLGLEEVTAPFAATVASVEVAAGEEVEAGRPLVRFYAAAEEADLARARREAEVRLVAWLSDPDDAAARAALAEALSARDAAARALEARVARASAPATVGDVRVRPGQSLLPGETLLTLARGEARPELLAFLPGHHRPALAPGLELRLELEGWPRAYQDARIETVGEEILGPAEARRLLGPSLGDALDLAGPVVLVRARLACASLRAKGRAFAYHDGMVGRAEARLDRERLLVTLVPALASLGRGKERP